MTREQLIAAGYDILQSEDQYRRQLKENMDILLQLDACKYPTLAKELTRYKGALCKRLIQFMEHLTEYTFAAYHDRRDAACHFVSLETLVKKYGGSQQTWHSYIVYWAALGLVERRKITSLGKLAHSAMAISYQRSKDNAHRPVSWYHVPSFTSALLDQAEQTAARFEREGISRSNLSMAGLMEAVGEKAARKAIIHSYKPSVLDQEAERAFLSEIRRTIDEYGYSTKNQIMRAVVGIWHEWFYKDRPPLYQWKTTVNRVWKNRSKRILKAAEAVYSRPTRQEKDIFGLSEDHWIIRKKEQTRLAHSISTPSLKA